MNSIDIQNTILQKDKYGFMIQDKKAIYNDIENISISIGNKEEQCIYFTILKTSDTHYQAKLVNLQYYTSCSLFKNLEKGKGTIVMLCSLKEYIQRKYPYVKHFVLEDYSQIECSIKNTKKYKKLSLTNYYFVLYRKTWYEDRLYAFPVNIDTSTYTKLKEKFSNKNEFISYKEFHQIYLQDTNEEVKNIIQELYENSNTYAEFFDKVREKSNEERCNILYSWLDLFMDRFIGIPLTGYWSICLDTIPCYMYIGGRKQTSKQYKTKKHTRKKNTNNIRITLRPNYYMKSIE